MPNAASLRVIKRCESVSCHLSPYLKSRQRKQFLRYTLGSALLGAPYSGHFCSAANESGTRNQEGLRNTNQRLKVVLDIDECLVHSIFEEDNEYRQQEDRPDLAGHQPKTVEQFKLVMQDGATCMVNKRLAANVCFGRFLLRHLLVTQLVTVGQGWHTFWRRFVKTTMSMPSLLEWNFTHRHFSTSLTPRVC